MSATSQNGCCAPRRGFTRRHCGALAARIVHRLAVEPHSALSGGRCRSVLVAERQRRAVAASGDQLRRAAIGFSIGGSIGLVLGLVSGLSRWGERLLDTSIQMLRNVPHLALIPLVILWFGIDESAKIFLVALGTLFPIYINTARHPQYRSWSGGDGAQLRLIGFFPLCSRDSAGRPALHYGRGAFRARPDVADADCGGNHLSQLRDWLSGNERPRIPANGRGGSCHYPYALLGKLADVSAQWLERSWLRWNPAYTLQEAKA